MSSVKEVYHAKKEKGYSIALFGTFGGMISVLFIAIVWFWAKKRRSLERLNKAAQAER